MNEFQEKIDNLSNNELLTIISSKDDYQEAFWQLAIENVEKRGLQNEIKVIIAEIQKTKIEVGLEKQAKLQQDSSKTEIYSDRAIIGISIIYTTLAGSLLFAYNLKKMKREGSLEVLSFGIIYTLSMVILMIVLPFNTFNSLGYSLNIIGGFIITLHYGNKYYPDNSEYKFKKSWKILLLAILIPIIVAFIYVMIKKNQ